MATAPPRWVGQTVARAAGTRFQDGSAGGSMSGLRRELQRATAMSAIKAADGTRNPLSMAAEGPRLGLSNGNAGDALTLDIFQMDIGGVRRAPEFEPPTEYCGAASDTCSEVSNDGSVMHVLEDMLGRASTFGGPPGLGGPGLEPSDVASVGRLFRNKSGHLPIPRPANKGGRLNAKTFGNLSRSLSGHRSRSSRPPDADQQKFSLTPPGLQLPLQTDWSVQSWAPKNRETSVGDARRVHLVKSAPVPIAPQFCKKNRTAHDDDEGPFMPPHEYLSRNDSTKDPDKAAFAKPSTGRLKGLSSIRLRNMVLTQTGFYDGYTEMWQQPRKLSTVPIQHSPSPQSTF